VHRSTDGGLEFHLDSPNGLRPDPGPGGGDTDIVTDDQGYDYFVDLESLTNLGTSVSNDNGNNWRKNPVAVRNTAVDRQWYAVDKGGNVYAAWIDMHDNNVYYSSSSDQGESWTSPIQVNSAPAVTNEFIWAQGGAAGTVALAWLGTDTAGQPDSFPNWATDPQGATSVKWHGYVGVITNATTASATIAQQRFTEKPMHYGQICNLGIGCSVSQGDRQMADYFGFNLDKAGAIRIVYDDTTNQH